MGIKPQQLKKDFPVFEEHPGLVYLDNAATSQKPQKVIDRISRFYREQNANPGRSLHDLAQESTQQYQEARSTVADFVGARTSEIVFTKNTTESMNLLASSLQIDGKILLTEMAHHSEQLPWRRKAEREGLDIDFIPSEDGRVDLEAAKQMIDSDTAIISVSQISNVFGAENPVSELTEIAHQNDALVAVDGAQSVPRMTVDVRELNVDFLAFSGHKMLGPTGTGVLYGRKQLMDEMEPYQVGGGMIRTVKRNQVEYEEPPGKFEAGTQNVAGAVGLAEAIKYLESVGMEQVYSHDRKISSKIIENLRELETIDVLSPEDSCLVTFTMEGVHPHDISEILNQDNIAIRAGHHCAQPLMESMELSATARASPYLYNTEEDVEKLLKAVEKVKEVFE